MQVQLRFCSVRSGLIPVFAPFFIRGCGSSTNILPCRLVVLSGQVVSAFLVQTVPPAYREIRSRNEAMDYPVCSGSQASHPIRTGISELELVSNEGH